MRARLAAWPEKIGGIQRLRLGADLTRRGLGDTHSCSTGRSRVSMSPTHMYVTRRTRSFNTWVMERDCTPLAFDYFIDESTALLAARRRRCQRGSMTVGPVL